MNATEEKDIASLKETLTSEITAQLQAGCITFSDGSYFCENPSGAATGTYAAPAPYFHVYAQKDAQGYQQIYMQVGGQTTAITNSSYDNMRPEWNKDGSLVAWQGLVGGRWQIFLYDRSTGKTAEVTSGNENNINPAIDGNTLAWQGWDAALNNWEIYMSSPAAGGTPSEVTHDAWAHVEPTLAGGLLAWQEYRSGAWQIFVDDIASGAISEVSSGGSANTDPRFLLAWTSEASGTSQAFAYDIATGKVAPLAAPPAPLPSKMPQPTQSNNNAALPAEGASTSTSSSSTSTKPQGTGGGQT